MNQLTQKEKSAILFAADIDVMSRLCAGIRTLQTDWRALINMYQNDSSMSAICLDEYDKAQRVEDSAVWVDFLVYQKTRSLLQQLGQNPSCPPTGLLQFSLSDNQIRTRSALAMDIYGRFLKFVKNGEYPCLPAPKKVAKHGQKTAQKAHEREE